VANFSTVLLAVTETDRSPAATFSQLVLCSVNARTSCTADHYFNGNNNGTRWHPWWCVYI